MKKKKRKIENKCCLQNCWQKGKNSLFLLNACPGLGRALPAAASEPGGGDAVCVGARGLDFQFVLGRLIAGTLGARPRVRSAQSTWAQIRSNPYPAEGASFP